MKFATLLWLIVLFSLNTFGQFNGLMKEVITHNGDGLDSYQTIRIHALLSDDAQLISLFGGGEFPVAWIQANGEVYQNPLAGATSLGLSGLDEITTPLIRFDSYVSIGEVGEVLSEAGQENMLEIVQPIETIDFELGIGPLTIGTESDYGYIGVTAEAVQSMPNAEGQVLIAQITTTENVIGEINLKILFEGEYIRFNGINLSGGDGCTDPEAINYDDTAVFNDGSCIYPIYGCLDADALNYNPEANTEDNTCQFGGCTDILALNYDETADEDDGTCVYPIIEGCTDEAADNFNPEAEIDNETCVYSGCTNQLAVNFNPQANLDDGSCLLEGCTNENALNFDPMANSDNGSCVMGCDELNLQLTLNDFLEGHTFNSCEVELSNHFAFSSEIAVTAPTVEAIAINWGDGNSDEFTDIPLGLVHNFETQGDYEIIVILTSSFGCEESFTYGVNAIKIPNIQAVLNSTETEICVNEELLFNLEGWDENHSSTSYKIYDTTGEESQSMSHPPLADPIDYSFASPSCSSSAYDGTAFAYGIKVRAENVCGSSSSMLPAIRVSGAMPNAEANFFTTNETSFACEEEVFNFVNSSNGFVIATQEGCINNNQSTWSVSPAEGWAIESGALNTPSAIGLKFLNANEYVVELIENELCATNTANHSVQIIQAAGSINGLVNLNDLPLQEMEVAAFKWSEDAGEFLHAESILSNEEGQFTLDLTAGNYQVKVIPNNDDQQGIIPMYTNEVWKWQQAEIFEIGCMNTFEPEFDLHQAEENGINIIVSGAVYYRDQAKSMQGDPIPGIPIIIEKDTTENQAMAAGVTDILGNYVFDNLPPGDYRMHVDMPGLPMAETHHFSVGINGLEIGGLNFFADSLDQIYVSDIVNILEKPVDSSSSVLVFPNPSAGTVNIEMKGEDLSEWNLRILDAQGRQVNIQPLNKKSRWQLDFENLPAGIYYYQMSNGNRARNGKIVKK